MMCLIVLINLYKFFYAELKFLVFLLPKAASAYGASADAH